MRRRFPSAARVRSGKDFLLARKEGISVRDDALRITLRARGDGGDARLGLAVSRRVGGAPVRNRMKRIAREVFRQHRGQWPEGCDLIVIPVDATPLRSPAELLVRVQRLLAKAKARAAGGRRPSGKRKPGPAAAKGPSEGSSPTGKGT